MADLRTGRVRVWDIPTRLFHWSIVILVALLWYTGSVGGLDVDLSLPGGHSLFLPNTDLHMLLGQVLLAIVLFRILWGVFGSSTARFANFVRGPAAVLDYLKQLLRGDLPVSTGHNPAGAVMVLLLLGLLTAQAVTGLFANDDIFSEGPLARLVSSDTSSAITSLHRQLFDLLLVAIAFHVSAVIYYLVRGKNLIAAMFTGNKPLQMVAADDDAKPPRMTSTWWAILLMVVAGVAVRALRLL